MSLWKSTRVSGWVRDRNDRDRKLVGWFIIYLQDVSNQPTYIGVSHNPLILSTSWTSKVSSLKLTFSAPENTSQFGKFTRWLREIKGGYQVSPPLIGILIIGVYIPLLLG